MRLLVVAALCLAMAACSSPVGRSFVQGEWYAKACDVGGGTYNAAPNGSCPDFLAHLF